MITGNPPSSLADWSKALDEHDVVKATGLPLDVILFCVHKGIVHPRQTEGGLLFPESDVLHLKLFRCIMYARHLLHELERCWRKAGDDAIAASKATLATVPQDMLETAEEALNHYRPIA